MARAIVLALALWGILAATASADVYDDNPATASRGPGDEWVFARATNGEMLVRNTSASGSWSDWSSLGGNWTSGAAAVGYGTEVWVLARGADGATYLNRLAPEGWTGWASLGGYSTSAPSATVRRGLNYLDVVIRGGDNAYYHQAFMPGFGWSGWASIGGNLTSGAAVNSQASGLLNVWGRATDGTLVQKSWTGAGWSDWGSLGGGIVGAPQTVARIENGLNVYARGAGNATYVRSWSGGWSEWLVLDSMPIDSSPAAGGSNPGNEWIFARKGDRLVRKEWNGGWQSWTDFGPVALPPPPAPPTPVLPDGEAELETGVRCTPPGGRLRVSIKVRKPSGKRKARVTKIVFFTKGKGRAVRSDRKAPFIVRIKVNRPAGSSGRVYARVYYRRSAKGSLHRKTVSRRYTVCR